MSESQNPSIARGSILRRVIRKVIVLSTIAVVGLVVLSVTAVRPAHLGVRNGKLSPVSDSPNCVSSTTEKASFAMEPIGVAGLDQPMEKLKDAIEETFPRAKLVTEEESYLHYEFTSLIFRFVDDGEFLLDEEGNVINFRSSSRVGYSDMGANRKRIESIRAAMGD